MDALNTFKYKGYTFKPFRKLTKRELDNALTSKCVLGLTSDKELNLTTYSHTYSHDTFYKASKECEMDLFICSENGRTYLPCNNELFLCANL